MVLIKRSDPHTELTCSDDTCSCLVRSFIWCSRLFALSFSESSCSPCLSYSNKRFLTYKQKGIIFFNMYCISKFYTSEVCSPSISLYELSYCNIRNIRMKLKLSFHYRLWEKPFQFMIFLNNSGWKTAQQVSVTLLLKAGSAVRWDQAAQRFVPSGVSKDLPPRMEMAIALGNPFQSSTIPIA